MAELLSSVSNQKMVESMDILLFKAKRFRQLSIIKSRYFQIFDISIFFFHIFKTNLSSLQRQWPCLCSRLANELLKRKSRIIISCIKTQDIRIYRKIICVWQTMCAPEYYYLWNVKNTITACVSQNKLYVILLYEGKANFSIFMYEKQGEFES